MRIRSIIKHMNLHKTFATPHGGGGPGSGPVAVGKRLLPYLPTPIVGVEEQAGASHYRWLGEDALPESIGRLSAFMGNAGIILRAYVYAVLLGREGMHRVVALPNWRGHQGVSRAGEQCCELPGE